MNVELEMENFVARLYASGVAQPSDLRGCSSREIAALGNIYSLTLPRSYALFLATMGQSAAKLGNDGEFDFLYKDILELTANQRFAFQKINEEHPNEASYHLPDNALVVCQRLGKPDYWLIRCDREDDSQVFHYDLEGNAIDLRQTSETLLGFLEDLRQDAEHWIRQGML